jgi:hypothetical protein
MGAEGWEPVKGGDGLGRRSWAGAGLGTRAAVSGRHAPTDGVSGDPVRPRQPQHSEGCRHTAESQHEQELGSGHVIALLERVRRIAGAVAKPGGALLGGPLTMTRFGSSDAPTSPVSRSSVTTMSCPLRGMRVSLFHLAISRR